MKNRYLIGSIIGGLALAALAFAHEGEEIAQTSATPRQDAKAQIQTQRQELKANLEAARQATKAKIQTERATLKTETQQKLQTIKTATPAEREKIRMEIKTSREALNESVKTMRTETRDQAKQLREDFRTNVKDVRGRAKLAAAHGHGLKMLNRFRAAIARFDHVIQRMESHLEKLKARGIDVSSVVLMIEEAKNMSVEAKADLEALKAKYEELLAGDNAGGIAEEARALATALKEKIQAMHAKLKEIARAIRALTPPPVTNTAAEETEEETTNAQ